MTSGTLQSPGLPDDRPTVSVVIVTRNRPEPMRMCLEHLERLEVSPLEVIVVDGSDDEATGAIVALYPGVKYLFRRGWQRRMCAQRNLGIELASGDVVAFIDDDSMVHPGWLAALRAGYDAPDVGGVGGRVLDEYEDARRRSDDPRVGILTPVGHMTANFGVDTGMRVEVNHLRGCNMSFRRSVILQSGGFDTAYDQLSLLDDTDMCLRVQALGYRLLFAPQAVVEHLSVRWRATAQRPSKGLAYWYSHAWIYSYLIFRNMGIHPRQLRHIFGGRFLMFWRLWYRKRSPDYLQGALGAWPGSLVGLLAALRPQTRS